MNRLLFLGGVTLAIATTGAQTTMPATTMPATTRSATTQAAINADMTGTEVIALWPSLNADVPDTETVQERVDKVGRRDRGVRAINHPSLTSFVPSPATGDVKSPAVILIPGGGYGNEVVDREGYFVAERLRAHGIAAFVLKYRLPGGIAPADGQLPVPILDAARAIRLVRHDAARWGVDPHRVGVMGFSAGGHVAGTAATHFDAGEATASDDVQRVSSRPDFAVLMYAVASMHEGLAHAGSRKALLGPTPDEALVDRFSTAQQVTAQTPPLLIVHAQDDKIVKYQNSVEVAAAAKQAGVPCEFITFAAGGHGFGTGLPNTEPDGWLDRFYAWLPSVAK